MSKKTFIDFEKIINNLGYKLLDTYLIDRHYRKFVIEDKIGYTYDTTLTSIQNKQFCIVGKTNPHALKNISLWLKLNNNTIELCDDNEYLGARENLKFYEQVVLENFEIKKLNPEEEEIFLNKLYICIIDKLKELKFE